MLVPALLGPVVPAQAPWVVRMSRRDVLLHPVPRAARVSSVAPAQRMASSE